MSFEVFSSPPTSARLVVSIAMNTTGNSDFLWSALA